MYPIIQDYTVLYNTQNIYSSLSCIHFVTFNVYSDVHVQYMNHHPIFILSLVLWLLQLSLSDCLSVYLSAVSPCLLLPLSFCLCFCLSVILLYPYPLHSSFCLSHSLSLVVITLLSVHVDNLPPVLLVTEEHQLKLEKEEDSKQMYHIKKRNLLLGTQT